MITLKARLFRATDEQQAHAIAYNPSPLPAGQTAAPLITLEVEKQVLSFEEWRSLPLVRNARDHVPEAKERELLVRQKKAMKFWTGLLAPDPGSTDNLTCLTEDVGEWPKGALIFERIHGDVGALICIDYLALDLQSLEVSNSQVAAHPHVTLLAAGPSGEQVGSEVMSVLSLVGMTLIASQPELGIPLMIGAQIFSFLFGHMGSDKARKKLPNSETVLREMPAILANETVKQLTGEANSVWDDIHQKYNQSWELGLVPSTTDLKDFEGILNRAISLGTVGSVHDNVNVIHSRIINDEDDKGHRTGLRWLPAFIWCATVELYCLELRHNLYYAWSDGGVGKDAQLNEQYANALNNWRQRGSLLHGQLVELYATAQAIVADRVGKIGAVKKSDIQMQTYSGTHAQTINGNGFSFDDNGTWPEPDQDNPIYFAACYPSIGCCSVTPIDERAETSKANTERNNYVKKVTELSSALAGISDSATATTAVAKWKRSVDLASSLIDELKVMKKNRK